MAYYDSGINMGPDQHTYPPKSGHDYSPEYPPASDTSHHYASPSASYVPSSELGGRPRALSNIAPDASMPPPPSPPVQSQRQVPPLQPLHQQPGSSPAQQPIYDAVNHVFDNAARSNQLPNDIISQIAEQVRTQVIDSLKSEGLAYQPPNSTQPSFPSQQVPLAHQQQSFNPRTRTNPSPPSFTPRTTVYTPPSPHGHGQFPSGSVTPEPPAHDPHFYSHKEDASPPKREESQVKKEDLSEIYGERTASSVENSWSSQNRPEKPQRVMTNEEETTLEKIWQPFFDLDGNPTARLGQFLRGIALHIIEDYKPKKSLVITPAKMQRFYEEVKVTDEIYPWNTIFGKLSNSAVCKIYRHLHCQHHLVQESYGDVPFIPALTPDGFQTWMTLMIQGHVELEFARLAKVLVAFPIGNADDRKERFPKELSRRLLPKVDNMHAKQRCVAAISTDPLVTVRDSVSFPPPPPTQPPSSYDAAQDRTHLGSQSSTTSSIPPHEPSAPPSRTHVKEDHKDTPPVSFKERERKPYVAKEGLGKIYNDPALSNHITQPYNYTGSTQPPTNHHPPPSTAISIPQPSSATQAPNPSSTRARRSDSTAKSYTPSTAPIGIPLSTATSGSSARDVSMSATENDWYGTSPMTGLGAEYSGRYRPGSASKPGGGESAWPSSPGSSYPGGGATTRDKARLSVGGGAGSMPGAVTGAYTRSEGTVHDIPAGYYQSNLYAEEGRADEVDGMRVGMTTEERWSAREREDERERDRRDYAQCVAEEEGRYPVDRYEKPGKYEDGGYAWAKERERDWDRGRERDSYRERERTRERERDRSGGYYDDRRKYY